MTIETSIFVFILIVSAVANLALSIANLCLYDDKYKLEKELERANAIIDEHQSKERADGIIRIMRSLDEHKKARPV